MTRLASLHGAVTFASKGDPLPVHWVYRLYDAADALLYVGVTSDLADRFGQHRRKTPWWSEVRYGSVEEFNDRSNAERRERELIISERPRYNQQPGRVMKPRTARGAGPERPLSIRIDQGVFDVITEKVSAEDGNRSDWLRRATLYSLNHMPRGWRPDEEASET